MSDQPGTSRLDSPPPAPSGVVRRVPDTAPAGMMMGAGPSISQSTLPQAVIERAMLAEQVLQSLAEAAPALTPLIAGLVDQLRSGVAGSLQGGSLANTAPMGLAGIMGMAQGAPSAVPAGPGAPPPMAA